MEAPESVVQAIQNIRPGYNLRWNPRAKLVKPGYIGANGTVLPGAYEGRWELWDKVDGEPEYRMMTLQTPEGDYRLPGEWLVELLRLFNPERYGGDVYRMLDDLMFRQEELQEKIADEDADDFFEQVAKWALWLRKPKVTTLTNI